MCLVKKIQYDNFQTQFYKIFDHIKIAEQDFHQRGYYNPEKINKKKKKKRNEFIKIKIKINK